MAIRPTRLQAPLQLNFCLSWCTKFLAVGGRVATRLITNKPTAAPRLLYICYRGWQTWLRSLELRVSLYFSDKVHQSKILGEWRKMIGYKMGFSLAMVYITSKISTVENFKLDEKMTWLLTWQYFFLGEFSRGQFFWATSNSLTRNLASGELQLQAIFVLIFSCIPIFFTVL